MLRFTTRRFTPSTTTTQPILKLPVYFHALAQSDMEEVHRIVERGYMNYWEHYGIKKGLRTPHFAKDEVLPYFEEAAEFSWRIRHALDVRNKSLHGGELQPVLRQLDGNAQMFLHEEGTKKVFQKSKPEFVRRLVKATLSDATGLVEKLTEGDVNNFVSALHQFRYDPCEHSKHILSEIWERHQEIGLKRAELREDEKFISEDSDEEAKWKKFISKLYEANAAMSEIKK